MKIEYLLPSSGRFVTYQERKLSREKQKQLTMIYLET